VAFGRRDRIRIEEIESGERFAWAEAKNPRFFAFRPDGQALVVCHDAGWALYPLRAGELIPSASAGVVGVPYPVFGPDGRRLVIASRGRLAVWDLTVDPLLAEVADLGGGNRPRYSCFSPDGSWLVNVTGGVCPGDPGRRDRKAHREAVSFRQSLVGGWGAQHRFSARDETDADGG
jgi:hypothetical protein